MEIITILASNISLFLYKNNIVDRHDFGGIVFELKIDRTES